ncbi:MAG: dihydrofolate reductase family protein [Chloroflexi bacterium]|nr:dihydrofolate reductase family protein [Chloroflexota bacterium]
MSPPRPYVIINVAASADGKIDTVARRGAAISSERDRLRVDALRASVDAVMVGSRTLHDEDPRLTVKSDALRAERVGRGLPENPAKVAIASHLDLAPDCRFLTSGPSRVILFVPRAVSDPIQVKMGGADEVSDPSVGVSPSNRHEIYPVGDKQVDLVDAMSTLSSLGLRRVLVEGGGTLNFELLRLRLVDELQLYVAPLVFGGATSPTPADGAGLPRELAIALGRPSVDVWQDGGVVLRYMVERS